MKNKGLLIIILLIACVAVLIFTQKQDEEKATEVILSQKANSSSGSYWEYELSTDTVINEIEYYESKFPLNVGPGYAQNWRFEVIGEGEITIKWLAYEGDSYKESDSYSITYLFDDEGKYTIVSELKYSSEYDAKTSGYIENLTYINETLSGITNDDEYQKSDMEGKIIIIEPVLEQLLNEGCITNYTYDLENSHPNVSIEYKDGGGCMVMFDEFSKWEN